MMMQKKTNNKKHWLQTKKSPHNGTLLLAYFYLNGDDGCGREIKRSIVDYKLLVGCEDDIDDDD